MAAFNYSELASIADELITDFGRSVILYRRDRVPENSAKPWRGPSALVNSDEYVTVMGVVNPSSDQDMPGTVIKRGDAFAIISANSVGSSVDLAQFDTLYDGVDLSTSKRWHILNASGINPGPVNLVWILHIKR